MAPNQKAVEWQTNEIIKYLLEDEDVDSCSPCSMSYLETDGPTGSDDNFDAAQIAGKLRSIADSLNDNVAFRAAVNEFKKEAAHGAIEAAFSHTVQAVCQSGVPHSPDVSPELQLLKTSVALGRLVAKSCPDLRAQVVDTMNAFITRNLGGWITQQGGWERISI
ncbi:hypothetical protein fugu_004721 [Takifugu bimaculatus]|uniref:Bcl-2-like protein 15 n=1 Tax=Takifugu bimaculatus TaxID=433685 RepID=A0A4Z2B8Y0_9TELE|nr:hypothetical protein fugu_004721 [Takifugu bimaculatus]